MKKRITMVMGVIAAVLLMQVALPTTLAQMGGAYNLTWNTIDGGGATFATGGALYLPLVVR